MHALAIVIGAIVGLVLINSAAGREVIGGLMLGPGQCAGCKGAA